MRGETAGSASDCRRSGPGLPAALAAAILLALPPRPLGAEPADPLRVAAVSPAGPFDKGALGIEFALGAFNEAWNLNDGREWLLDGTAGVWWSFADRAMLVTEFHAARVFQSPSRAAYINGFTPLLRWRVLQPRSWTLFVDLGPGISWSDTVVPPRGTRFNYLLLAGTGLSRRIGAQTHAVVGFRWLHVSNNGREGRGRNPDIEALGGYGGISVALSR